MLKVHLLWLLCLKSCLGHKKFPGDSVNVGSRRMFDPLESTRRIDTSLVGGNKIPHATRFSSRVSDRRRQNNGKRRTRKSQIRGSTTFSRLLNIDPSFKIFPESRYPRHVVSLGSQARILTNIMENLPLLELACRIQPCSRELEIMIMQAKSSRYFSK